MNCVCCFLEFIFPLWTQGPLISGKLKFMKVQIELLKYLFKGDNVVYGNLDEEWEKIKPGNFCSERSECFILALGILQERIKLYPFLVYKNHESLPENREQLNKVSVNKAMNPYECTSVKFYLSPMEYDQCFFQLFHYVNMLQHILDGLVL